MPYTIGYDYGTESGRAVLVDTANGREAATAVHAYTHGVMETRLPTGEKLGPDWALQHPQDYIDVLVHTTREVLERSGVGAHEIIGLGTDFTACTPLPTLADGTPLCFTERWRRHPHAWTKLWKHHAAQGWADKLNALARSRGEGWLDSYGGKISSEWLFPKLAQIADEAPEVYAATEKFIEAADWIVWQLTGVETRNSCTAGYKAIWDDERGYVSADFLQALHPRLGNALSKLGPPVPLGRKAGELTPAMAAKLGLRPGIAVCVGNVDAHVSVPACGTTGNGVLVSIMGTSCCDLVCGATKVTVPGMCGVVKDGVIPGTYGYEAGQSGFGDHFAWLSRFLGKGDPGHAALEQEAAAKGPGGSGLLALDWFNGNRSVLVDHHLSGMIVGLTLASTPADVYLALIEGLAYGRRMIIDTFQSHGVAIERMVACGGIVEKNRFFMQTIADVCQRPIHVARSAQTPALGSAIFAAVAAGAAAGGHRDIHSAAQAMGGTKDLVYTPDAARGAQYEELYQEYRALHDRFGRVEPELMHRLRARRR